MTSFLELKFEEKKVDGQKEEEEEEEAGWGRKKTNSIES